MRSFVPRQRRGAISSAAIYFLASFVAIGLLGWFLIVLPGDNADDGPDEIVLYCAAGIQKPVAEAVKQFEEETYGVPVRIQYGGSGALLTTLQAAKRGDLYLAADVSYMELAREKGLLAETIPLGMQRPVIAVKKGNPKEITCIADLLKSDVKLALANPDAASIGKLTKKVLTKTGQWDAIKAKTKVFKPTVNDILTDVIVGTVDAAIVWDANVVQLSEKLDLVRTPEFNLAKKTITIGVLKWTKSSAHALRLARYLQAPEKGQKAFEELGYELLPNADKWAIRPTIQISSGGVNRVAIDKTLKEFAEREGVEVRVTYNGCGVIVGEIKLGARPDAYFACDISFMDQVQEHFFDSVELSETDMVIAVAKGNPKNISKLEDLTAKGLKVGVTNAKKSALGKLTEDMLDALGLLKGVSKNVSVDAATADTLVNGLIVGSLDVAIVYRANTSQVKDKLEVITITEGKPKAVQPIALGKESKYPHLTQRLVDALTTEASQERFETAEFRWLKTTK